MLAVPMLAIVGSEDIRPSWPVEQVANLMPCAYFQQIEGAGHYLWLTHLSELSLLLIAWTRSRKIRLFGDLHCFIDISARKLGAASTGGIMSD